jgi:hypothetical protein
MRKLTESETILVSGGDDREGSDFWADIEDIGIAAAGLGAAILLCAAAPEVLAVGAITEGALFLTSAGTYVTVDASVIAQGAGAITTALSSAGVTIGAGGAVVTSVGHIQRGETPLQ